MVGTFCGDRRPFLLEVASRGAPVLGEILGKPERRKGNPVSGRKANLLAKGEKTEGLGTDTCHNYIGHNYIGHNYIGHNYIAVHLLGVDADICVMCLRRHLREHVYGYVHTCAGTYRHNALLPGALQLLSPSHSC